MTPLHKELMKFVHKLRTPNVYIVNLVGISTETREAMAALIAKAVAQDEKRGRRRRKRGKKVKLRTASGKEFSAVLDADIVEEATKEQT